MQIINDEYELRKLCEACIGGTEEMKKYDFIIKFVDNKSGVTLFKSVYDSPIAGVRVLPTIIEQCKLPVDDIDVVLSYAISRHDDDSIDPIKIKCILSRYVYFQKTKTKK